MPNENIKNLPDKIYLNLGDLEGEKGVDFNEIALEVAWCTDKIDETDVPYFRKGKIAELKKLLAESLMLYRIGITVAKAKSEEEAYDFRRQAEKIINKILQEIQGE